MFFPPRRNDVRGRAHGGRGGRSKGELTAQEELAKAREERERRKRQKLEQKSAVVIQAAWRGWSSRCTTRRAARSQWNDRYGSEGQLLQARDCFGLQSGGALGSLLRFYHPATDLQRLASIARVYAGSSKSDEFTAFISAYTTAEGRAAVQYRLKTLALQCLMTLSWHRLSLAPQLAAARPTAPLDASSGGPAGALLECLLQLVSPDLYAPALGRAQAAGLSAALLTHLADHGMCQHLFMILAAALAPAIRPPSASAAAAAPSTVPLPYSSHPVAPKPYVEALVTQLTVRLLALKSWSPPLTAPEQSLHCLLFLPDLWRRCRSLQPVAPRVCRQALAWLAAAGPQRLAALLPPPEAALPGGDGAAVAVLLANLLAVGPQLLQPAADKSVTAATSLRAVALSTARVLHAVVSLLPLSPFFPEALVGAGAGAGDDEDEVDEAACGSLGLTRLTLPPGAAAQLPAGLVEQVQGVTGAAGRQLINQLVSVLLPYKAPPAAPSSPVAAASAAAMLPAASGAPVLLGTSPPFSTSWMLSAQHGQQLPHSSSAPPSASALLEAAEAAHAVSELVWQLTQLPGQQQRVMLGLAVSADFVERMWWSFLRPARLAELYGIAWLPDLAAAAAGITSAGGCGGGGGGSPSGTFAPCSRTGSYTFPTSGGGSTGGATPMEIELPPAAAGAAGATAADGGGEGTALYGSGSAVGVISNACVWRPRVAEELGWLLPLAVCCSAFSAHISTATLEEFYGGAQRPLALQQLYDSGETEAGFLSMLRDGLWHVLWSEGENYHSPAGEALYAVLARTGGQLYGILYERNCRRQFCPTEAFHASALAPERFLTEAATSRSNAGREDGSSRVWQVLHHAPYLVPFADRARLFQMMVAKDREEHRAQEDVRALESGGLWDGGLGHRFVPIRRDQLLFDGFDRLNALGERLRGRVRISFIDAHGVPEAGVDGGGLFKDFMEELMRAGMSAQYGLFAANTAHQLYPNPAAMRVVEDAPRLLAFLGRMLGKAMYEGVLLELPLAGFFLKKFRGAHCDLNDLPTLDPDLYRSLLLLREHLQQAAAAAAAAAGSTAAAAGMGSSAGSSAAASPAGGTPEGSRHGGGEAAAALDLGLTFVVADDVAAALGDPGAEVELKPGGRNIPVTADNVREYMHRVAHYKLNISPRPAASAFLSGFYELIPRAWVSMFSGEELQALISGADSSLDLGDMRAHVEYAGGYHDDHPVIHCFWEALASFSPEQQGKLLKFVTSCSRAPLLGFRYLEPRLCIQMSGAMLDPSAPNRLPTASTCMNLLKLPPYRTSQQMRDKLLYAINAAAGFDLS